MAMRARRCLRRSSPATPARCRPARRIRSGFAICRGGRFLRGKAQEQDDQDYSGPDWDDDDIPEIVNSITDEELAAELAPILAQAIADFGSAALEQIANSYDGDGEIPDAFSMTNPAVTEYLENFGAEMVGGIGDTTRERLASLLSDAYANGDGIDDVVAALQDESNGAFGDARAENIARTEIVGGSNFGTLDGYKQSGVVDNKGWMATPGTQGSRESHEDLDGVEIGIHEVWTDRATGATAQHPGGFGDPASDCNCRCSIYAAIDDHDDGKAWRSKGESHASIERRRAPHVAKMKAAAAKVLDAQRAEVIKRLLRKAKA